MKKFFLLSLIIVVVSLSFGQNVYNVGKDKDFVSIKDAIEVASEGDKILIDQGIYNENVCRQFAVWSKR